VFIAEREKDSIIRVRERIHPWNARSTSSSATSWPLDDVLRGDDVTSFEEFM